MLGTLAVGGLDGHAPDGDVDGIALGGEVCISGEGDPADGGGGLGQSDTVGTAGVLGQGGGGIGKDGTGSIDRRDSHTGIGHGCLLGSRDESDHGKSPFKLHAF